MIGAVADDELDLILALQFAVAWAGEGLCEPRRLGWWRTDLVDEVGGGDLFARLTPRLARWSALEAVRETARRFDESKRREIAEPEKVRTLYHLGFRMDENLATRLSILKASGAGPADRLPFPADPQRAFSATEFADALSKMAPGTKFIPVLGGRQLEAAAFAQPARLAGQLAAALVPFPRSYPMPFARTVS